MGIYVELIQTNYVSFHSTDICRKSYQWAPSHLKYLSSSLSSSRFFFRVSGSFRIPTKVSCFRFGIMGKLKKKFDNICVVSNEINYICLQQTNFVIYGCIKLSQSDVKPRVLMKVTEIM